MSNFEFSFKKIVPFLLVGFVIIFALAAAVGTEDIIEGLSQVDKSTYALAFLVQVGAIVVWLSKWKILTMSIRINVRTRRMFPILLSGIFVNTAVPSAKVGGEPLRAYMFSKLGNVPMEKSLATVMADRAVDGIPLIAILFSSLISVILMGNLPLYGLVLLLSATAFMIVVVIAFLYVCLRPSSAMGLSFWLIRRLRRIISKFRPVKYVERRVEEFMEDFGRGARAILGNKRYVSSALGLSTCYWLLAVFRMWLVFFALGYPDISLGAIGLAVTLGLVLHVVPIPGGLGVVESLYVLIFKAAGVSPGIALTAALLDRGISFWFTSLFSGAGITWSSLELSRSES
ncbi:hypothetical protein AKJ65_00360 [candidate division MSBL1 archaeon SCGC-AAA259E19]|uniref:Flippase-like domain-containing protein n=2 Tax=candidate division MSBL1 TaxID=215777 RepID=A0A133V5B8_9EURY|nr:hypothetical protein AKJ65_00360 [candidate division MSBL1 archaeon SCGC-AAA259E19]KXB01607.1 hypothetical protein AKJ41_01005 [candidate division MSBL1 archaeon SCGC-AAA259O05]